MELRGISKTYPGRSPVTALHPSDLTIQEGESVAIVGPSGSGKSTLLNLLGLLDVPTTGTYSLAGVDISSCTETERCSIRGQKFGFVFQAFHLLPQRSVVENVELAMMYSGLPARDRRTRAEESLARLGLGHRVLADPRDLSGGERQRTAIARALCLEPEVLFCDEPTGNLDSKNSRAVIETLFELNELGQTLVMVTHDMALAAQLSRVVHVEDGRLGPGGGLL
ncbi:ABC transporter ATP-binding protein [Arthrobacter woluwensis]|uniref:Putative ABC transport system ATP-binding protein n=1 Tax=Arthrobacter woluwensis TaxID=156980 RepID=A0A1H4JLW4_9MICC|nr:ABC transporter ATP-binding protein [Arthrobacter woluwensis]SEB47309.1 putative ABC transport system ATP-binding protein [Arthrobacter woluwensis]